jgi:hypothetical protein
MHLYLPIKGLTRTLIETVPSGTVIHASVLAPQGLTRTLIQTVPSGHRDPCIRTSPAGSYAYVPRAGPLGDSPTQYVPYEQGPTYVHGAGPLGDSPAPEPVPSGILRLPSRSPRGFSDSRAGPLGDSPTPYVPYEQGHTYVT